MLVTTGIYGIFLFGLVLLFNQGFSLWISSMKRKQLLNQESHRNVLLEKLRLHLIYLLTVCFDMRISLTGYLAFTMGMAVFFSMIACFVLGIAGVLFGMIISLIPYGIMRLRLANLRYQGSHEGETLLSYLLNHYRIKHFNIYEAMESVIAEEDDTIKITSKFLFILLVEMRNSKDQASMQEACRKFSYSINTNWSNMLGQCIYAGAKDGMNIVISLEDLMAQLRSARKLAEEKKRLNAESTRLVKFLIPFSYFGSIFVGVKFLGTPLSKLIQYQLLTRGGLILLFLVLSLSAINIFLIDLAKRGKFDY